MPTIGETLQRATALLMGVSGTPRQDAQAILGHVMDDKPREFLIAHSEQLLNEFEIHTFEKLLALRIRGMPLAYILGRRAFYDRTFRINPQVLIPRPETEHVVEAALGWSRDRGSLRIVDVGTGSGIIATFIQADLLAPLHGPFDIICANLPYIATGEMNILDVALFEPHVALDGGNDGLALIRRLLEQAPSQLGSPGLLLMEIGADQGPAVEGLARAAFPDAIVDIIKDYAHLDRVVRVERT